MRRWNGWGDESVSYPVAGSAIEFIERLVGAGRPSRDVNLKEAISRLPKPRISRHPLITTDPQARLVHSRGQSFPDWFALRTGQVDTYPDGVAFPLSNTEVRD